jgi:ubiquinone/menaquinone biosynthesis C-methylase UbiE
MELDEVKRHWEGFAQLDPLWAILTIPGTEGGKWDPRAFFQSGENEVRDDLALLEEYGVSIPHGHALDFGCGVGRLTQGLAKHFDRATGMDIAPTMIRLARSFDAAARCRFIHNETNDLSVIPAASVDFLLTLLVLQHMAPRYSERYVREFFRVLRPGGAAIVQLPSGGHPGYADPALNVSAKFPSMEMHFVPRETFISWVQESGGEIVAMRDDNSAPPFPGTRYVLRRKA